MSIEKTLQDLTAALTAQTEAMNKLMASGSTGAGTKAAVSTTGTKPAQTAAQKKAAAKAKADEGPSVADIADRVTGYMKSGDKDERAAAKANIAQIVAHFGADRFTLIENDNMTEALDMLNDFMEGRTPEALGGEDDEMDDDIV